MDAVKNPPAAGQTASSNMSERLLQILGVLFLPLGVIVAISLFTKAKRSNQKSLYLRGILIIIAALVVAFVYMVAYQRFSVQPYKYTYTALDNYKISDGEASLKLQKPQEFLKVKEKTDRQLKGETLDTSKNTKDPAGVMYLTVNSSYKLNQDFYKSVNAAMKSASGTTYNTYLNGTKDYIKNFVPEGYRLEVSRPSPFTSSYIKANAWQFGFTITRIKNVGLWANTRNLDVKGKMIDIFTDSAVYYMAVRDSGGVWDNNQAVWNKVFDSLQPAGP